LAASCPWLAADMTHRCSRSITWSTSDDVDDPGQLLMLMMMEVMAQPAAKRSWNRLTHSEKQMGGLKKYKY